MIAFAAKAQDYTITDFGAVADGKTLNTASIQKAIDAAAAKGGGRVIVPKGTFLTGTVRLRNNINLHLSEGAVLLGSTKWKDYEKNRWYAIVLAQRVESISITGKGMIDGQGRELAEDVMRLIREGVIIDTGSFRTHNRPDEKFRPQLLEIRDCKKVTVKDVTLKNSSCWVQTYGNCTDLLIDGIKVESNAYWNNDGIDVVDCKNVVIKNCDVDASDDGICLKSGDPNSACENIEVTNCRIRSSASALKFGTPSHGGFKNIRISKLYVYNTFRTAIALELVDGGVLENIQVSDITAVKTGGAIFIRLGERKPNAPNGVIRNVHISKMKVEVPEGKPDEGYDMAGPEKYVHNPFPSIIAGLPGHMINDVTLDDIEIVFNAPSDKKIGYVPLDSLSRIRENPAGYPEFNMFGEIPAWGFYVRHASGIKMTNIRLSCTKNDFRPVFVFDDVQGLQLDKITVKEPVDHPAIVLNNVTGETLSGIHIQSNKVIQKQ